jgi:hypothetical protein
MPPGPGASRSPSSRSSMLPTLEACCGEHVLEQRGVRELLVWAYA